MASVVIIERNMMKNLQSTNITPPLEAMLSVNIQEISVMFTKGLARYNAPLFAVLSQKLTAIILTGYVIAKSTIKQKKTAGLLTIHHNSTSSHCCVVLK